MPYTQRNRLSAATIGLLAALLTGANAPAQPTAYTPPPGAAPPWGETNTTPTTEAKTIAPPAAQPALPAAQAVLGIQPGTVMPDQAGVTPMQGTTTPIHAVSLHAGPNAGAPIIGILKPGMQLHILATANYGWREVNSPIGSGWAWGSYLAPPQ